MSYLRSLIFVLIMVFITPPLALIIIFSFPLPPRVRLHSVKPFVNLTIWLIEHVMGIRYRVLGGENIPSTACVVLAKHQSMWETLVLQKVFRDTVFVYKRELHFLCLSGTGCFPRTNGPDGLIGNDQGAYFFCGQMKKGFF